MKKMQYVSPSTEVINLRVIDVVMNPWGDGTSPADPHSGAPMKGDFIP